jgi:hypothetical protein
MIIEKEDINKLSVEKAIKRLEELSKLEQAKLDFKVDGSIWKDGKPVAEEPDYFQKAWFNRRMKGPAKSWKRWNE